MFLATIEFVLAESKNQMSNQAAWRNEVEQATESIEPEVERSGCTWNYENQNTLVQLPTGARVTTVYNAELRRVRKE